MVKFSYKEVQTLMMLETNVRLVECPKCGQDMRSAMVKTAIWIGERLFVVEDVPAQVCDSCVEQFYDEQVTEAIRRLTQEGFPSTEAKGEILVPVFSLQGRIKPRRPPTEEELLADY